VDPESFTKIVSDYATEKFDATQAASQTDESFTLADGSKAKNIPLGGRDVYGRANEYDLWGAPSVAEGADVLAGIKRANLAPLRPPQEIMGTRGPASAMPTPHTANTESATYRGARDVALKRKYAQAQGNMVRSDANNAAMQRLMALRTMLGG